MFPETYVPGYHYVESVKKMEYRKLGETDFTVSKLSLGVSALGSVFRPTDDTESWAVVDYAIKSGINFIDASPFYGDGKAEKVLGEAIRRKRIPRKAFYMATKVGRFGSEIEKMFDFRAERVTKSVDESLERLGLDYIDLLQVHDMEFAPSVDIIVNETLPALQKLKESGKVKMIGITCYPLELFRTVIERSTVKVDTVLTYCHYCLNDTSLLEMLPYFQSRKIGVINASPTGMGLLTNKDAPGWHPATDDIKETCRKAASYCQEQGVDISKLALNFSCSNPDIPTTLVSTASLQNVRNNLSSVTTDLSQKEMEVSQTVRQRYFEKLGNKTWESIEIEDYWKKLEAIRKCNTEQ